MKKGLIMEDGALRGMFTCGVIDVFLEENIDFDGAAGISAGASFGCNFKSCHHAENAPSLSCGSPCDVGTTYPI